MPPARPAPPAPPVYAIIELQVDADVAAIPGFVSRIEKKPEAKTVALQKLFDAAASMARDMPGISFDKDMVVERNGKRSSHANRVKREDDRHQTAVYARDRAFDARADGSC